MEKTFAANNQRCLRKRKSIVKEKKSKDITLYLLLVPGVIYLLLFCYAPLYGLIIAFKDYNSYAGILGSPWTQQSGFAHFIRFVTAPNFWQLIRNTLVISLYSLAVSFPLTIILALFINEIFSEKFKRVVQTISYAPYFISTVVVVGMLFTFFNVDSGVINSIIKEAGGTPIHFMTEAKYFSSLYVFSGLWQSIGWSSIIYVATLSGVSPELHEAAVLDGAGRVQRIWHINLPSIKPVIMITLILNIGNIMSIGFEKVYLMQTAGNLETSEILSTFVYRVTLASKNPQYSFGTAAGLFNSVINIILLCIANVVAKKCGQESLW